MLLDDVKLRVCARLQRCQGTLRTCSGSTAFTGDNTLMDTPELAASKAGVTMLDRKTEISTSEFGDMFSAAVRAEAKRGRTAAVAEAMPSFIRSRRSTCVFLSYGREICPNWMVTLHVNGMRICALRRRETTDANPWLEASQFQTRFSLTIPCLRRRSNFTGHDTGKPGPFAGPAHHAASGPRASGSQRAVARSIWENMARACVSGRARASGSEAKRGKSAA